jgi:hypothetical protein
MGAGSPLPDAAHRIMRRGFDNMLYASVVLLVSQLCVSCVSCQW